MESIGIIGGGVVGLCCAYYLNKDVHEVTVIDEGDFTSGCSYLNAGMIVPSHVVPLAAPGVVGKGIKWMLKADSPFAFHFSAHKDMLRWLWLFNRSANEKNVHHAIPYLRDISWLSKSLYQQLAKEEGFNFGYDKRGLMMLYQTAEAEKEEIATADFANKTGVRAEILPADEVQKMEPELKVKVRGGIYFPGDAHLNPEKFMQNLKVCLQNKGVQFMHRTKVTGLKINGRGKVSVNTLNRDWEYDEIVVACGTASGMLLKGLPLSLPLQGGKGYSLM
ncbi:MAG: NAD(P)/FAD-dependent oxidoreductase, partial [Chitinophagaceae bacterium]